MGKAIVVGGCLNPKVPYSPVFANNTWAKIIEACQNNSVPETWVVGDQKAMTIDGTTYTIDIIGKNHDVYSDGSGTAPLTFQMHNVYGTKYAMDASGNNRDGWTNCDMRKKHLPTILTKMPSEVQLAIKEVNKLTSAGDKSTAIETTEDKLFLLSVIEIFGTASFSVDGEGTQYAYYAAGNSTLKSVHDDVDATDCAWRTRSPHKSNSLAFACVSAGGAAVGTLATTEAYAVAFAFCF